MVYAEQRRNMAKDEIANVVIFRGSRVCLGVRMRMNNRNV